LEAYDKSTTSFALMFRRIAMWRLSAF